MEITKSIGKLIAVAYKTEKERKLYIEQSIKEAYKEMMLKIEKKKAPNLHKAIEKRTILPYRMENDQFDTTQFFCLLLAPLLFSGTVMYSFYYQPTYNIFRIMIKVY